MDTPANQPTRNGTAFNHQIRTKVARKLRAQRRGNRSVWAGLGMSGIIGWSVAVPTLAGAALGLWLDKHYPGKHVWTLALLMAGLAIGCLNAWFWVAKQDQAMRDEERDAAQNGEKINHDE